MPNYYTSSAGFHEAVDEIAHELRLRPVGGQDEQAAALHCRLEGPQDEAALVMAGDRIGADQSDADAFRYQRTDRRGVDRLDDHAGRCRAGLGHDHIEALARAILRHIGDEVDARQVMRADRLPLRQGVAERDGAERARLDEGLMDHAGYVDLVGGQAYVEGACGDAVPDVA